MTEHEKLIKTLAMEESLKKSRAMITYTSDRLRVVPPNGRYYIIDVTKTFVPTYKPKGRRRTRDSV